MTADPMEFSASRTLRSGSSGRQWLGWLLLAMLVTNGCTQFAARRLAQAPNTFPEFLTPKARVAVEFHGLRLDGFVTNSVKVGPIRAALFYRVVEPGDYRLSVTHSNRTGRGHPQQVVSFRAIIPPRPLPEGAAPRGTIILLHGYGLDQFSMLPWALRLAQNGWRCVLVDLRGHGKSTGRRIYFGTVETFDLAQLLDTLEARGEAQAPVKVLGESYGAALALRWAVADLRVDRVVAIAPYPELARAVLNLRAEFASWFPEWWVRGALRRLPDVLDVRPERLNPATLLPGVRRLRALFVAGESDRIAPLLDVRRLYQSVAATSEFLSVPEATHEGLGLRLDLLAGPVSDWFERGEATDRRAPSGCE